MKKIKNYRIILVAFMAVFMGCTLAEVKVDVKSERTTLENQVLGAYNAIDKDMLLLASVRGVDSTGNITRPPRHSQEHKDAVTAMQVQAFHADDLQAFKQLGWAGENNDGLITPFAMTKDNIPDSLKDFAANYPKDEFEFVISEINNARMVVMERVIAMNENLSERDLAKVQKIFAKLNAENAVPGEKIQTEDGNWIVKR